MAKFAQVGDYCMNEACRDYGKQQSQQQKKNIKKFGKTRAGRQRYQCNTCESTFTERERDDLLPATHTGRRNHRTLALVAEGSRISSLERAKGHQDDTILAWIRAASEHAETIEAVLLAEYQLERGQLDALWAYVGNNGEKSYPETDESGQFWRATMIDSDTRLRAARGIAKTETEASIEVFQTLQQRGHPEAPPPTISDGWGGTQYSVQCSSRCCRIAMQ